MSDEQTPYDVPSVEEISSDGDPINTSAGQSPPPASG
jgi:hypothetical protein